MKTEYWTLYRYGESEVICSKHKSYIRAILAIDKCENRGGARHRVVEVNEVHPYKKVKK
jgi:hypothetical protein